MAVAALMAGCLGADEEAQPATGAPRAIAEVVHRLERATAARAFAAICGELFTAGARERAGGRDCARVRVRTRAVGQAAVSDVLVLRRGRGEWRVDSLGG
jgi:hypothetical protein